MNAYHITEYNSGGFYMTEFTHDNPFVVGAYSEKDAIAAFQTHTGLTWAVQNRYGPRGNSCACCGERFTISEVGRYDLRDADEALNRYIAEVI